MKHFVTSQDPKIVLISKPRPYAIHRANRYKDTLGDIVDIAKKEFPHTPLHQLILKMSTRDGYFLLREKVSSLKKDLDKLRFQ
jgi:hypothetical protein